MTQLNGNYYSITNVAGGNVTIADLNGVPINSTTFTAYISGGTASRVYKIPSPYIAADLALVKYAQNVNQMILCHPSYPPQVLTLINATNWNIVPITIGSTASPPTGLVTATTLAAGAVNYAYVVTTIDGNGQESLPSARASILNTLDIRTNPGTNGISWTGAAGAVGYNVYEALVTYLGTQPVGTIYGFIGSTTSTSFNDTNIAQNFNQTPPIGRNPFLGSGVASVTITSPGTPYFNVPTAALTVATSTIPGSLAVILTVQGTPAVTAGGSGYSIGDTVLFTNGVVLVVATLAGSAVATWQPITVAPSNPGAVTAGATPTNPVPQLSSSGAGTGVTAGLSWGVGIVLVLNPGAGYLSVPTVTFSAGAATATAILSAKSNGFPSVPSFFQQRLILAGPLASPQTLYMSQPGQFFNFNVSSPTLASDAITATLVSGQLNTIKSMTSQTTG